ncbi:MAG: SDR family NAD(P)-dependent oxidoreductase [Actinobacteria bacterium]|jgi:NAD(P)-dependent dehydrogenase (short-subunit alcohol dehydrogenase family)|nr:MAG: SDR family NAD(P)-dependent oxidoreductase [Actinomycetota bacterium]
MQDLKEKAVLVTGAASGIGRATAVEFAREGADPLILSDINPKGLEETAALVERLGCRTVILPADVSDYDAVKEMASVALDQAGRVDILVNVAGTAIISPLELMTMEEWKKVVGVDLFGALHTVHCLYPHMLERGSGHIVNIASVAGLLALHPYNAPYYLSKFGTVGFTEALMLEASAHGIGVTCICPGGVKTPIYDDSPFKGFDEEVREKVKKLMLASAEEPEDTARAIVDAVKKNRYLVVTTPVARAGYFIRRHFSLAWFPLMRAVSRRFVDGLEKYRVR